MDGERGREEERGEGGRDMEERREREMEKEIDRETKRRAGRIGRGKDRILEEVFMGAVVCIGVKVEVFSRRFLQYPIAQISMLVRIRTLTSHGCPCLALDASGNVGESGMPCDMSRNSGERYTCTPRHRN